MRALRSVLCLLLLAGIAGCTYYPTYGYDQGYAYPSYDYGYPVYGYSYGPSVDLGFSYYNFGGYPCCGYYGGYWGHGWNGNNWHGNNWHGNNWHGNNWNGGNWQHGNWNGPPPAAGNPSAHWQPPVGGGNWHSWQGQGQRQASGGGSLGNGRYFNLPSRSGANNP